MNNKKRIVVGMSGGIDSSMAALILKNLGYEPIGVSLDFFKNEEKFKPVKAFCEKLRIEHQIINVTSDFKNKVIDYFTGGYKNGKTPNPCVICNRFLKIPSLMRVAKERGVELVATGHYARVRKNEITGLYELLKAIDDKKDQTYFLCLLNQGQLSRLRFPLGELTKDKVRILALKSGFKELLKIKESQDICFLSGKNPTVFLSDQIGVRPGLIKDVQGKILGKHKGAYGFTVGQRQGLRLSGGPWYVVGFKNNDVLVSLRVDDPLLYRKEVVLDSFNMISGRTDKKINMGLARIRSSQSLQKATLILDSKNPLIIFDQPIKAVTPGQFAVFYQGEVCVGGGEIAKIGGLERT